MKLHQVNKSTLISLAHVIKVEIEPEGKFGATQRVRWHLQDRTSFVQQESFRDHAAALTYIIEVKS